MTAVTDCPIAAPAMGFVNVIADDFHLHLRGGAVAAWNAGSRADDGEIELIAADGNGEAAGLVLRGPERVLAARPLAAVA